MRSLYLQNSQNSPRLESINTRIQAAFDTYLSAFVAAKNDTNLSQPGQDKMIASALVTFLNTLAAVLAEVTQLETDLNQMKANAVGAVLKRGKESLLDPVASGREIRDVMRTLNDGEMIDFTVSSADAATYYAVSTFPSAYTRKKVISDKDFATLEEYTFLAEFPPATTEAIKALSQVVAEGKTNYDMAIQMRAGSEGLALQATPAGTVSDSAWNLPAGL